MIRETDPLGHTHYIEYDSRGNVVSTYDERGAMIVDPLVLYTNFGAVINDFGNPVRYAYDRINRRWRNGLSCAPTGWAKPESIHPTPLFPTDWSS